ncbi:MAG TPA: hypothetical protein VHB97_20500, partial [Polyangia bacterium]|nr:hypothetical protein [Polyangia bacterium]
MSGRGDDRGGPPRRNTVRGFPGVIDAKVGETKVDADVPTARALTVPRRGQLLVPTQTRPLVAARLPSGMAT